MRTPVLRLLISLALLLSGTSQAQAAVADAQPGESRIVVFGDVHGAADELQHLLQALAVIDAQANWIGGDTRLVSLGDLLDRGADSRRVMDLLMHLETQAPKSGGRLYMVLGNHEIMNLTGDLRYVADEEFAAFADPAEPVDPSATHPPGYAAHRAAFQPTGHYGRWLLDKPQVLELDGTAFVHGGLSSHFETESIVEFNERSQTELTALLKLGAGLINKGFLQSDQDLLSATPTGPDVQLPAEFLLLRDTLTFTEQGPTWYRGTASCHPVIEQTVFKRVLEARKLRRVIMGHTPTNPRIIQSRFAGRAILADTGMLETYYRGRPSAVIIEQDSLKTLTLNDAGELVERLGQPAVDIRATGQADFNEALTEKLTEKLAESSSEAAWGKTQEPLTLEIGGRAFNARFQRGRKRELNNRLAASALDQLLELGLVAPVVAHTINGMAGTVEVLPAGSIDELERISSNLYRPNPCAGSSDYQLLYALDALLGLDIRAGESLNYDRRTWLMYLTDHDQAFPTTTRLPRYLENTAVQLPIGFARTLARLDTDRVEDALGSYLGDRQIKALLARRDLMLQSWTRGVR